MVAAVVEGIEHLRVSLRAKCVVDFGAVDGDAGDSLVEIEKYVGVFLDCGPVAC